MEQRRWDAKPYYSLDSYFRSVYGEKIYKLALDGGMTCPVRDGSISTRGCCFCSMGGSGEYAAHAPSEASGAFNADGIVDSAGAHSSAPFAPLRPIDIDAQLAAGRALLSGKYRGSHFVAYLQPFTNTYADPDYLLRLYTAALAPEEIVGLSIATRPDCLGPQVRDVLAQCQERFPEKFLWVELGLQTIHPASIRYIRRGYDNATFEEAVRELHSMHIPIIVHSILGLPGENRLQMRSTVEYLNTFPIFGIKLQLLHILRGTDLAIDYAARRFEAMTLDEYIDVLIDCIEHLSPETVIHRLTGDGPKELLLAPLWSQDKHTTLNTLLAEMDRRGSYQGKAYAGRSSAFV